MSQDDPVVASLEDLAERCGDVTGLIQERFAAHAPDSAALMNHMDDYMVGRMMQDVLLLLMTAPDDVDRHYLSFEVASHRAYGVTAEMFPPLFRAVREIVQERLGDRWNPALEEAWNTRIAALTALIDVAAQ